jgi:type II secretory pathway pseudopilin PulG
MANRRGVTLLELILALALSAFILVAIGMAIDLNLRSLDARRSNVEQAQLARAVLRRIADDLRSAVRTETTDFSSVDDLATNVLPAGTSQLSSAAASAGVDPSATSSATNIADSLVPPAVPGLYGNQYELQVDISRLPRLDEYQIVMSSDPSVSLVDIPSDVKTVAYYIQPSEAVTADSSLSTGFYGGQQTAPTNGSNGGLVRRELDRAVTQWAMNNANYDALQKKAQVLAPEVAYLEFRYFDGTQWWMEWDSQVKGTLPVAVEIALAIVSPQDIENQPLSIASYASFADLPPGTSIYRLVVRLPVGEPTPPEETGLETIP